MTVRAFYSVFCNVCGDWVGQERTARQAREVAKLAGWTRRSGVDRCPDCSITPTPKD